VTIVLPNSVEWIQAAVARWKLGAVPQPLSPQFPDPEFEGSLELRPRALLVGREDPKGEITSFAGDSTAHSSEARLPEAVSPCWKSMASGGSTGRPKLVEAGGDSRITAIIGYPLGAQEGDTTLVSVPLTHNTGLTTAVIALLIRHHLVAMSRFEPHEFLRLIAEHRVS
jgi:bile acid-coenzyme A ligase